MLNKLIFTFVLTLSVHIGLFAQTVDDMWEEVSRTVQSGDFEGYAAVYHPDAVLVNGISGDSYPISEALAGWKQGFDDTRSGNMEAKVAFQITERLLSETTAHDTGIFRYSFRNSGEEWKHSLVHFQALMVKKEGKWLMMMEYQQKAASQKIWDKLINN